MQFDCVILGAGPGGYVAAIRAAQLGMKVAIVEKEHLGGICLNWGCIPTKALLKAAEVKHLVDHADIFGIKVKVDGIDLKKMVQRSRDVSAKLSAGIKHLLSKNKVSVYLGKGMISGRGEITIDSDKKEKIQYKNLIIATGARARIIKGLEPDGKQIWTSKEAMIPDELPKSILIIGSGAIGMEFASFYHALGVDITVVEMQKRILPQEDTDISDFAKTTFQKKGIKFLTETTVESISRKDGKVTATLGGNTPSITVSHVIVAAGIVGNTEGIGLENTKVKITNNQIETDGFGQTAEPNIYAIGDVAGAPWLAHKASHEAIICVEKIAGLSPHPMNKLNIPGCTYCSPQIASLGLTEEKAKEQGYTLKVGKFPLAANGKALALNEPDGFVKTIFDAKTGELLGAHMIGAEVTEMIQGFVIAKSLETTEEDLMHTIFPHPTISEAMHESVLSAYDRAIHI